MMQQPQMVPPQAQAMKPVSADNIRDIADLAKMQVAFRDSETFPNPYLAQLTSQPYPVGTFAQLEISRRNREQLVADAQAAGSGKDINQQDIEQLALGDMRNKIANDENMGVPNIVNQMEQNPTMMAASGGMVEGYKNGTGDGTVGRDAEEELKKFKDSIKTTSPFGRAASATLDVMNPLNPKGLFSIPGTDVSLKRGLDALYGATFKQELSDAQIEELEAMGIDPEKYIEDPDAAIKAAKESAAPGTVSPSAGTERSPYSISPVRDKTTGKLIRDKDGNLIADPDVSGFGGGESGIRVIDTTDQTLADAKDRASAGLEAIRAGLPEVGTAKLGRLGKIEKADLLGGAKTYEEALRQRRQAAGLGELGAGQLTRAEETAEKDKAFAKQQANLKLVEAGKAIQRGQKGGIQTIGDVLGGLAERKVAADAGERTAEKLLTAKRDAIELKREAEARGDVEAGLKFDKDIVDSNLKIQQKNVDIANQEYALNKNAETQRTKILADIGLRKSQLEVDFIKLDQMGKYRDMIGNAQLMMAQAKSGGATQKDLITLRNNVVKNITKLAEAESDYGDPAKAKELRSKATNLLNMEIAGIFGMSMPEIENIPE